VAQLLLSELTPLIGAQHGTFYIAEKTEETVLKLLAGYATDNRADTPKQFRIGQGLVGQCAKERARILATNVPKEYIRINSSLGGAAPVSIVVLPVLFEGDVKAAIELASFGQFSDVHLAFLDQLTQSIGIVLNTIAATMRTEQLLQQSQALAEELQSQQQQLQTTNEELQEKAQLLAEQKTEVETKNQEVEQAKKALEEKAEQLSLTSKYKSEFLANMSHELRTPLNNLLILARMLSENTDKNLTSRQVKFAETIHTSGTDLLALISDILDLSKIESGKMDVEIGGVRFVELQDYCSKTFRHVADGKGLEFTIDLGRMLSSEVMHTDAKRLQQVLKNLLSNALKFTDHGSVYLNIDRANSGWTPGHPTLSRAKSVIAFTVSDTGIGIHTDKQRIIFEAFQQADGTTSRKYGGTGLGLSISRELARLLGGEIRLQSVPNVGSTFTLYLPQTYIAPLQVPKSEALKTTPVMLEQAAVVQPEEVDMILRSPSLTDDELVEDLVIDDDRNILQPGDSPLLIVEDDITFARILLDMAHDRGLKALVALRGGNAISLAREFKPGAITLDINLPDIAGWTILDRLKHDAGTRHIPVHIISGDEDRRRGLALGAMTYLEKSVPNDSLLQAFAAIEHSAQTRVKKLLVVCPDEVEREDISDVLAGPDLEIIEAATGGEAMAIIREHLDGIVIHLPADDSGSLRLVEDIQVSVSPSVPPMIILSTRVMSETEELDFSHFARASVLRRARTLEDLLDQSVLLLHRDEMSLSPDQRRILQQLRETDSALIGKTVLVVDDDVRNIFALTSLLEDHKLRVMHAENGRSGIDLLRSNPNIDLVLMDIMMPGMDGYETTKAIRAIPQFRSLPIIALTAKAMKGDRAKCLEAGASDYITKPVDLEQLFSVLRVWISRSNELAHMAVSEAS
jgi:signal transduction histidine kinase/CheY-like chemotaxis protein